MLTSLLMVAFAQSDLAVHTVGVQAGWANAVGKGDVDLLLGERLRWSLTDDVRVWADARVVIDPDGKPLFQRYRVRRLGVQVELGATTLWVGRHPVLFGSPQLVDGLQAVVKLGPVEVGAWAGLAPDLFTTAPRLRFGAGPLLAYTTSKVRASLVGDVLFTVGGVDRVGVIAAGRYAPNRLVNVDTRWDLELVGGAGARLVDGRFAVGIRPSDALRFSVFYNAFSSFRYLRTENLDPELRRFDQRILEQGLSAGFDQDQKDPVVNHMVGLDGSYRGTGESIAPILQVTTRYRHHPELANRFARATVRAGLGQLPAGTEITALGTVRWVNASLQADAGAQVITDFGGICCQLDTSAMALINPARYSAPGFYGDLFTDVVLDAGLSFGIGANALIEPLVKTELGLGGFARLAWHQRHKRQPRDAASED